MSNVDRKFFFLLIAIFLSIISTQLSFAQWDPDIRLTLNDSISNLQPACMRALCVGSTGTLHAVWSDKRNGNYEIYYKRSTDQGSTWSADCRLTNNSAISSSPSVSSSGSQVNIVWSDEMAMPGNPEIYFMRSTDDGVTWGSNTRLTDDDNYSLGPSSASSGSNIYILWWDDRGPTRIYYKYSTDNGITWSSDAILSSYTNEVCSALAVSGSNVHAFWCLSDPQPRQIYYRRSTDSGVTWNAEACLTACAQDGERYPSAWATGSDVHLAWHSVRPSANLAIYYKRTTDNGLTWSTDTLLNPGRALYPSISASGTRVGLVWEGDSLSGGGYARNYFKLSTDRGATWVSDTCLSDHFLFFPGSSYPHISLDNEATHMIWMDGAGMGSGNYEIFYKHNLGGAVVTDEEDPSWIESSSSHLRISPNPFTSRASVEGHGPVLFYLYDAAGRMIGSDRGDRLGDGLAPGVYFIRELNAQSLPARIVKIR